MTTVILVILQKKQQSTGQRNNDTNNAKWKHSKLRKGDGRNAARERSDAEPKRNLDQSWRKRNPTEQT